MEASLLVALVNVEDTSSVVVEVAVVLVGSSVVVVVVGIDSVVVVTGVEVVEVVSESVVESLEASVVVLSVVDAVLREDIKVEVVAASVVVVDDSVVVVDDTPDVLLVDDSREVVVELSELEAATDALVEAELVSGVDVSVVLDDPTDSVDDVTTILVCDSLSDDIVDVLDSLLLKDCVVELPSDESDVVMLVLGTLVVEGVRLETLPESVDEEVDEGVDEPVVLGLVVVEGGGLVVVDTDKGVVVVAPTARRARFAVTSDGVTARPQARAADNFMLVS